MVVAVNASNMLMFHIFAILAIHQIRAKLQPWDVREQPTFGSAVNFDEDRVEVEPGRKLKREINEGGNVSEVICYTEACKITASKIAVTMDPYVHPCNDFYKFACDGHNVYDKRRTALKNMESTLRYLEEHRNTSEKYHQVYSTFYRSCTNYASDLRLIDKSNIFMPKNLSRDLTDLMREIIISQSMPIFDFGLDIQSDESFVLQITIPGASSLKTGIHSWSVIEKLGEFCSRDILNDAINDRNKTDINNSITVCSIEKLQKYVIVYKSYMNLINGRKSNDEQIIDQMEKLLKQILEYLPSTSEIKLITFSKTYDNEKLEYLSHKLPLIDWQKLFEGVHKTFNRNDNIQIYFKSYLENIFGFLNNYNSTNLQNILIEYYNFQLFINTIVSREEDNDLYCFSLVNQLMPDVLTAISYDQLRHNVAVHRGNYQVASFFNRFRDILEHYFIDGPMGYLTDILKNIKLGSTTSANTSMIRKNYDNIDLTEDEFQINLIRLIKNFREIMFSLADTKSSSMYLLHYFLDTTADRPKYFYGSPYIVYHPSLFLNSNMDPDYVGLAKVGMHIARELVKNFILTNDKRFDNMSETYTAWKERTATIFTAIVQDLGFSAEGMVDSLIINEMLIDNGAFRIVYDHFQELENLTSLPWISQEFSKPQIFYLSAAQEYCQRETRQHNNMEYLLQMDILPENMKVHNVIRNSEHFLVTFNCTKGSSMDLDSDLRWRFPDVNDYEDEYST